MKQLVVSDLMVGRNIGQLDPFRSRRVVTDFGGMSLTGIATMTRADLGVILNGFPDPKDTAQKLQAAAALHLADNGCVSAPLLAEGFRIGDPTPTS